MRDLPIYELENEIVGSLARRPRLILQAPTGSGKSTQVPQILLDRGLLGEGEVVILQPRRLATRLLATRVAPERGGRLGDEVGYQIRFEKVRLRKNAHPLRHRRNSAAAVAPGSRTARRRGDPLRRIPRAPSLRRHHARPRACSCRKRAGPISSSSSCPPRSSRTNSKSISRPARALLPAGGMHPVAIEYLEKPVRAENYPIWDLAADELDRLARSTEGDALIFMPGKYEITRTISAIRASRLSDRFVALAALRRIAAGGTGRGARSHYEKRKVDRRHQRRGNFADHRRRARGHRQRAGAHRAIRSAPRHQHASSSKKSAALPPINARAARAAPRPGDCLRLWTEREHLERRAAGTARSKTTRSRGSRSDA